MACGFIHKKNASADADHAENGTTREHFGMIPAFP